MPHPPSERDFRIDVVRGAALLIILTDHFHNNPLASLTPRNFGLSDMAEVFVFLSGCVCGMVYGRVAQSGGLGACVRKAALRIGQLALACALTVGVLYLLQPSPARDAGPAASNALPEGPSVTNPGSPLALAWNVDGAPLVIGILSLYGLLLLLLPGMLWLQRRHWSMLLIVSWATYCLAQAPWPDTPHAGFWFGMTPFNPLAWQFLFALGILADPRTTSRWLSAPGAWRWQLAALIVLEAAFVARFFLPHEAIPLVDKARLGPLRLLHLCAVMTLALSVLPLNSPDYRAASPLRWIARCGQSSLIVFCSGTILVVWCEQSLLPGRHALASHVVANVGVWTCCVLIATAWQRARRRAAAHLSSPPRLQGTCCTN